MEKTRPDIDRKLGAKINDTVDRILAEFDRLMKHDRVTFIDKGIVKAIITIETKKIIGGYETEVKRRVYQRLADNKHQKIKVAFDFSNQGNFYAVQDVFFGCEPCCAWSCCFPCTLWRCLRHGINKPFSYVIIEVGVSPVE